MSQKGIFSIASGAQERVPSSVGDGVETNQFSEVKGEPVQGPVSEGAASQPEQYQHPQGEPSQADWSSAELRPNGRPLSYSTTVDAPNVSNEAAQDSSQQAAVRGEPFQMNGFKPQTGNEVMEAAPVAAALETSPFMVIQGDHDDYEVAKANLEPQQDFAVLPDRLKTALESTPWRSSSEPAPSQSQPVQPSIDSQQQAPQHSVQAPNPAQQPTVSSTKPSASSGMQQLELRAIFGVDYVLDVNQILQRARSLSGILNVAIVGKQEAEALANFRHAIQGMGLGDFDQMKLNSNRGSVDFISEGNTTLAIQLEGSYAPGVKETLIIVAREIGKLA